MQTWKSWKLKFCVCVCFSDWVVVGEGEHVVAVPEPHKVKQTLLPTLTMFTRTRIMGIKSLIRIKSCEHVSRKILIWYSPLRVKLILNKRGGFPPIPNSLNVNTHSDRGFPVWDEIILTVDFNRSCFWVCLFLTKVLLGQRSIGLFWNNWEKKKDCLWCFCQCWLYLAYYRMSKVQLTLSCTSPSSSG